MKGLKICLWIAGVACALSFLGIIIPVKCFGYFVNLFAEAEIPDSPLFVYLFRIASATYAAVGVFFIILALKPLSYGFLTPFSGIGAVFIGAVCGIVGCIAKIPPLWYLGDSLSCLILGFLILFFWKQATSASENKEVLSPQ